MSIPLGSPHDDIGDRNDVVLLTEAFSNEWHLRQSVPDLREFHSRAKPECRNELLEELIKIDLEQRWSSGLSRFLEDYIDEFPQLADRLTATLIFEECICRRAAEDEFEVTDYFTRFPKQADQLKQLFRVDPRWRSAVESLSDLNQSNQITLESGDTVDDFEMLLKLGRGAFAVVFLARQKSMQRLVAVKVSANKGDEPQTLAQLDHDNIVRVYDQRHVPERNLRLLYMQFVPGGTLADVVKELKTEPRTRWSGKRFLKIVDTIVEGRGQIVPVGSHIRETLSGMTWPQVVCWIGSQLARALNYAHHFGVLHRDLKPANVLLTSEGIPKLADFNISFSSQLEGSNPVSYFGGSLSYMSPEQLEACDPACDSDASTLDHRSDLYSLGVVLWEMLEGNCPFDDDSIPSSWGTHLVDMVNRRQSGLTPQQFDRISFEETPGLAATLVSCLEPIRENRFSSGIELARELELCLQPEAKRLLCPMESRWKRWAAQWPAITVALITVVPNIVAAIFNFLYNRGEIVRLVPGSEPTFMKIQTIINSIAFPTGVICAGWLTSSVSRATKRNGDLKPDANVLAEQRRRCLRLGNLAALVCITLWMIAAPAYPIALHVLEGTVPLELYGHFIASLVLCGLIASAYPFFGVSFIATRVLYPLLLRRSAVDMTEIPSIRSLSKSTWLYLVLAASVPMVAVMTIALSGLENRRFALIVLAAGGTLGFGIAVSAFRLIQSDLMTLENWITRD